MCPTINIFGLFYQSLTKVVLINLTNTSSDNIILEILFLTFSLTIILFADKKFTWRFYITSKALSSTIHQIKIIDKKEFVKAALKKNVKIFVIYIVSLSLSSKKLIHLIRKVSILLLVAKKIAIIAEYLDFINVFL